jgi:hypothetical protein
MASPFQMSTQTTLPFSFHGADSYDGNGTGNRTWAHRFPGFLNENNTSTVITTTMTTTLSTTTTTITTTPQATVLAVRACSAPTPFRIVSGGSSGRMALYSEDWKRYVKVSEILVNGTVSTSTACVDAGLDFDAKALFDFVDLGHGELVLFHAPTRTYLQVGEAGKTGAVFVDEGIKTGKTGLLPRSLFFWMMVVVQVLF